MSNRRAAKDVSVEEAHSAARFPADQLFLIAGPCQLEADALNLRKKDRLPVFSEAERLEIVAALRCVDEVFVEESLEQKRDYILQFEADVLVMGDDWAGKFDEFGDICEVVYLTRTPAISTTALIEKISSTS